MERTHRPYFEALKKSKRAAARKAVIKRKHPPVNVLDGYHFSGAPAVDLSPLPAPEWAVPSRWFPTGDGADVPPIPEFLRRTVPATASRPVEEKADLVPEIGLQNVAHYGVGRCCSTLR